MFCELYQKYSKWGKHEGIIQSFGSDAHIFLEAVHDVELFGAGGGSGQVLDIEVKRCVGIRLVDYYQKYRHIIFCPYNILHIWTL